MSCCYPKISRVSPLSGEGTGFAADGITGTLAAALLAWNFEIFVASLASDVHGMHPGCPTVTYLNGPNTFLLYSLHTVHFQKKGRTCTV